MKKLPITHYRAPVGARLIRYRMVPGKQQTNGGFGIIEVIVAIGIFAIVAIGGLTDVLGSFSTVRLGDEYTEATVFAKEAIEAAKSIRNQTWSNITAGTFGLNTPGTGVPPESTIFPDPSL